DKWKKVGAVAGAGLLLAAPVVGVVGADSEDKYGIPEDWYDDSLEKIECCTEFGNIMETHDGFKVLNKPLDEPIMTPDYITKMLEGISRPDEKFGTRFGVLKISPTDLAVWMALASERPRYLTTNNEAIYTIESELVYIDIDGDGKPEELSAQHHPWGGNTASRDEKYLEGHFKKTSEGEYLMNPFEAKKNLGLDKRDSKYLTPLDRLVYIENPDKITIIPDKSIQWYEAIGKTPRELGLDKYDGNSFEEIYGVPKEEPKQCKDYYTYEGEKKYADDFKDLQYIEICDDRGYPLQWNYKDKEFDCSEMSAAYEWYFENQGYHAVVAGGPAKLGKSYGFHNWVLLEEREGSWVIFESTDHKIYRDPGKHGNFYWKWYELETTDFLKEVYNWDWPQEFDEFKDINWCK
ncbi:MAG: hypothetical protein KAU95_00455, partial [Candidatus Aenigmarchaeota archaeon]|nr:hypothetical protein [Candidatus Aenigmarchaeota archaeon]